MRVWAMSAPAQLAILSHFGTMPQLIAKLDWEASDDQAMPKHRAVKPD